ncbi:hypothetical protein CHS0354_022636 [Potamilus streckersoni]|uniref:Solute carrier family 13 member 2 n=1 Tax=Potamilus streckersoni TaxID=2493646 RepID=A0AAE0TG84_9BIVA|nr:hypothetical protein CHS0354_022636 [Potamilus streckersoni]
MNLRTKLWVLRNILIIVITPLLLLPLLIIGTPEAKCGFTLLLMAVYWATEAFPIAVTALLPVMLFPMTGLMTGTQTSKMYIADSSMLFVGGLIMAIAVEHWNIHRRIALRVLLAVGTRPLMLMMGLMLSAWFLSMWTSNMATTAMMCPIAHALLKELEHTEPSCFSSHGKDQNSLEMHKDTNSCGVSENSATIEVVYNRNEDGPKNTEDKPGDQTDSASQAPQTSREHQQMAKAISLSIAYASNIGGTTTITGCASNIILKGMADEVFAKVGLNSGLNFASWLVVAFPISLLQFILLFLWLNFYFNGIRCRKRSKTREEQLYLYLQQEYRKLGSMRFPEISVLALFVVLIFSWVSRDLGGVGGWGNIFRYKYVTDSAAPTLVAVLLFLIPANIEELFNSFRGKGPTNIQVKTLLTWNVVHEKLPWGLFLLFGGGFALAEGCKVSGLSNWIRQVLVIFSRLPSWITCLLVTILISLVTEVTTNTAAATLTLPIIQQLALSIGQNPLYLMIPATMATSYAFILPVATPPNALVYSLGYVSIYEMMKAGFILNFLTVGVATLGVSTWGAAFFDLYNLPDAFNSNRTEITSYQIQNNTML